MTEVLAEEFVGEAEEGLVLVAWVSSDRNGRVRRGSTDEEEVVLVFDY